MDEIRNSTRDVGSLAAKRARECPTGRCCVEIQRRGFRAVIGAHVVIGRSERWPNLLVLFPIGCEEPGQSRALVDGKRGVVLGGNHFVDEASDLVPTSYPTVACILIDGGGGVDGRIRGSLSLACASGDHVDYFCCGIVRCRHVQACQKISLRLLKREGLKPTAVVSSSKHIQSADRTVTDWIHNTHLAAIR